MSNMEPTFAINEFNQIVEYTEVESDIYLIANILLMKEDTLPTAPGKGFNINRYKFEDIDETVGILDSEIKNHISKHLPQIDIEEILVLKINNGIAIGVSLMTSEKSVKNRIIKLSLNKEKQFTLKEILKD